MQKIITAALCSSLYLCSLSSFANTRLNEVFNGQMLGTSVRQFESLAGPARQSFAEQQIYRVAGCTITATVRHHSIKSLRLELSPSCHADLHSFIGDFAPPTYRALTFGAFADMSFYASCLSACGNAADPVVSALWRGPRAVDFTDIILEVALTEGPALEAAAQWQQAMSQSKNDDWIEQAQFNCERDFDNSANQYFKHVQVSAVTIGQDLPLPKCW